MIVTDLYVPKERLVIITEEQDQRRVYARIYRWHPRTPHGNPSLTLIKSGGCSATNYEIV